MKATVLFLCLMFLILGKAAYGMAEAVKAPEGAIASCDKWCLTVKKGDIFLEHYAARDYINILLEGEIFTAIDFDSDNTLDIFMNNGRFLDREKEKDRRKYEEAEKLLLKWKEEVGYPALIEIWKEKRGF